MTNDFSMQMQPDAIPGQPVDSLFNMVERNRWAGGNILRGELPAYPTIAALPTATADYRYRTVVVSGASGTADALYICMKSAADTYAWLPVGGGGLAYAGGNNTESSAITSTTAVTAVTVSGLSIATNVYALVQATFRKTTGAAATGSLGVTVNATNVQDPFIVTGSNNAVDAGTFELLLPPREANYLTAGRQISMSNIGVGGVGPLANAMPAATITSILITALVSSASISLFVKNVRVYTYPTS